MHPHSKPILTSVSWNILLTTIICAIIMLCYHKDDFWLMVSILVCLLYPLLCYGFVIVKYYNDCVVVIRPFHFIRIKTIVLYKQIVCVKVSSTFFAMASESVLIYLKNKKRPIATPHPFFEKKQQELEEFIKSKEIDFKRNCLGE